MKLVDTESIMTWIPEEVKQQHASDIRVNTYERQIIELGMRRFNHKYIAQVHDSNPMSFHSGAPPI